MTAIHGAVPVGLKGFPLEAAAPTPPDSQCAGCGDFVAWEYLRKIGDDLLCVLCRVEQMGPLRDNPRRCVKCGEAEDDVAGNNSCVTYEPDSNPFGVVPVYGEHEYRR
jgi:hypothetical protein